MKLSTLSTRIFLASFCILTNVWISNAQVGVNTTSPDASAALDITSSNKGFLMTKVALTGTDDVSTITPAPTTGLLLYNTATAGSSGNEVTPGYYYFNGSSWRRFFTQGYTLEYEQTAAVTADASNTTYVILPGLDTGEITVPFSGTYQIRAEAFYAAGDLINNSSDGAAQGSISVAYGSKAAGGGGSGGCTGGITSWPYTESFESSISWTQDQSDDREWVRYSGSTPSGTTGPSGASDGTYYAYVEASGNGTGYPNKQAILESPCFDFTGEEEASIDFDYHMYGSNMGSLTVEVSTDDGASWGSVWTLSGNQGNSWYSESVDLSDYAGGPLQVRFNAVTGSGWRSDIAIDNITVTNVAGPAPPPISADTLLKETYLTTSSKSLGGTAVNNLAQSASIIYNIDLVAGTTYRFAVRGREWLGNNVDLGSFGRDTSGYTGSGINDAQRGTMTISLIKQH